MDPLSLSASIVALVDLSTLLVKRISVLYGLGHSQGRYEEFLVYESILHDLGEIATSFRHQIPETMAPCIRLCHRRLEYLQSLFLNSSKIKRLSSSIDIERGLKGFSRSVKLLRDVMMDSITHKLLQDQHNIQDKQMKEIQVLRLLTEDRLSHGGEQRHTDLEDLAEKLRSMVENTSTWQPDTSDPFSFSATILHIHQEDSEQTVARGKLDSGCDGNWISTEILQRAKLEDNVEPLEDPRIYTAFDGGQFEPMGKIDITWYAVNAGKSRKTTFLVHDNVPFDMVLGRIFIKEESIFMFNEPALALQQGKFKKEELQEIQKNAIAKGATNQQLSSIRRVDDATTRQRLRQEKAVSQAVSRASMTPAAQSTLSLFSAQGPYPYAAQRPRLASTLSQSTSVQSSQNLQIQTTQSSSQSDNQGLDAGINTQSEQSTPPGSTT